MRIERRSSPVPASPSAGEPGAPGERAKAWRFWGAAYALLVLLTGTNLPTPLYRDYEQRFGFSPLVVTLIFAAYVAVLIPSLLVAGPLSDAIGRRRVLLPAVVAAALGSLGFALASGTGWLFAARVLQGLAVGLAAGPLTAALTELEPSGDHRKAALVSTVVSVGGLGIGPVLAGLLAQYAPAPRVLPFVVEIVLLLLAAAAIRALPDARATARWRPRRPEIPAAMRSAFATSGTANFLAFAVIGLFLALVPTYVAALAKSTNLLLGGGAVALMLACSAIVQLVSHGKPPHALQRAGLPVLAVGLGLLALAGSLSSLVLLLIATALAGVGQGLVFLGGLTAINHAAPADRRTEVLSSFYVIVYSGVGLPVIGVGFLATGIGLVPAVRDFAVAVAVLCLIVLFALRRTPTMPTN
ncbi:Predicted arabinose efflux permease, MFS family [Saccharopolyspora antimicrobica]|uniref:MFS family arabinose efflux permease n=1 Tax=Saccharopolyspora antimicrobica TaxID=455193 RepID=A0A1I5JUG3_9PSEU|nr:MFS transporter [Saccharopolyspora antimicrobica]RKT86944.1 putative MFS family arabinose efflux permease [Saccharopolyspora antimicrobica]SFO76417.1 Predicted arabinose efflux permease, MFS family [Saccharopolyspora antimicrobica]